MAPRTSCSNAEDGDDAPSLGSEPGTFHQVPALPAEEKAPRSSWVPVGRRLRKQASASGLLGSFVRKKGVVTEEFASHSSHPAVLKPNQAEFTNHSSHPIADCQEPQDDATDDDEPGIADLGCQRSPSLADSFCSLASSSLTFDELGGVQGRASLCSASGSLCLDEFDDIHGRNSFLDSDAMLESLGDDPSDRELDQVAAVRAAECIEELDREAWDRIPQYPKSDLLVGQFLGKGSFSDVFEVMATEKEDERRSCESGSRKEGVDELRASFQKAHGSFSRRPSVVSEGDEDELDKEIDAMFGEDRGKDDDAQVVDIEEPERDELDKEIEAMFGFATGSDGDEDLEDVFHKASVSKEDGDPSRKIDEEESNLDKATEARESQSRSNTMAAFQSQRQRPVFRRATTDLGKSLSSRELVSSQGQGRKLRLAMKCLRPQIRSDHEQFLIGVEDLVHETAMLASLDHPHVIKLHGRAAGGCASDSSCLGDGYFLLVDRLKETLEDRIVHWKKTRGGGRGSPPRSSQVETAVCVADALSYLHAKGIVFCDLKPANVGYDSEGKVKLFDFGFAIRLNEASGDKTDEDRDPNLVYDKRGTPRYMAPEMALERGYDASADVYSFGILLWEICALELPFKAIKSADELHKTVFVKGARPKVGKGWAGCLKDLVPRLWAYDPTERPSAESARDVLAEHARELSSRKVGRRENVQGSLGGSFCRSSMFRRRTG